MVRQAHHERSGRLTGARGVPTIRASEPGGRSGRIDDAPASHAAERGAPRRRGADGALRRVGDAAAVHVDLGGGAGGAVGRRHLRRVAHGAAARPGGGRDGVPGPGADGAGGGAAAGSGALHVPAERGRRHHRRRCRCAAGRRKRVGGPPAAGHQRGDAANGAGVAGAVVGGVPPPAAPRRDDGDGNGGGAGPAGGGAAGRDGGRNAIGDAAVRVRGLHPHPHPGGEGRCVGGPLPRGRGDMRRRPSPKRRGEVRWSEVRCRRW